MDIVADSVTYTDPDGHKSKLSVTSSCNMATLSPTNAWVVFSVDRVGKQLMCRVAQ